MPNIESEMVDIVRKRGVPRVKWKSKKGNGKTEEENPEMEKHYS